MRFNAGDKVTPNPEHATGYLQTLIGATLTVKKSYMDGDIEYVQIEELSYVSHSYFAYRLMLVPERSPYYSVIAKIKQMENRRKELGYAL